MLNKALVDEGVLPAGRSLPGDRLLYAVNDRLGENLLSMGLVRAAARVAKGWRQDQVQAAGQAGRGRPDRAGRPLRAAVPGRLPGRAATSWCSPPPPRST